MKRETLKVQRDILQTIKKESSITLSQLERIVGTNPRSLKQHVVQLEYLGLIKIKKTDKTTMLKLF